MSFLPSERWYSRFLHRTNHQHLSSDQNTGLPSNGLQAAKVISINQSEVEVHDSSNLCSPFLVNQLLEFDHGNSIETHPLLEGKMR